MIYIIESNRFFTFANDDKLIKALSRLNLKFYDVDVKPFMDEIKLPSIESNNVMLFGSTKLARLCYGKMFSPGIFMNDVFDMQNNINNFEELMLNSDSVIQTMKEPIQWLNKEMFIRPVKDDKFFTGRVFDKDSWASLLNTYETNQWFSSTQNIVVSLPKQIYAEYRFWVVNGKIVTSSQYKLGTLYYPHSFVPPEAIAFAQKSIDKYQPIETFCIDVGQTENGYKIIELNCLNCSGFYESSVITMIQALEDNYNKE